MHSTTLCYIGADSFLQCPAKWYMLVGNMEKCVGCRMVEECSRGCVLSSGRACKTAAFAGPQTCKLSISVSPSWSRFAFVDGRSCHGTLRVVLVFLSKHTPSELVLCSSLWAFCACCICGGCLCIMQVSPRYSVAAAPNVVLHCSCQSCQLATSHLPQRRPRARPGTCWVAK